MSDTFQTGLGDAPEPLREPSEVRKCEPFPTRRGVVMEGPAALTVGAFALGFVPGSAFAQDPEAGGAQHASVEVDMVVNGAQTSVSVDPRTSLLDLLREQLDFTGTKKGCNQGACGACTVHMDGERVLSCLTLAVQAQGSSVTTVEGLAPMAEEQGIARDGLHPIQAAFIENDGLQCGYCTPGQMMSAVACIREGHATDRDTICEYMSGNLCRCGAHNGIIAAIEAARDEMEG